MKCNKAFLFVALLGVFALTSCSGLPGVPCTVNCGGGNAVLSFTLSSIPLLPPPPGTSILSFTVDIAGIQLTPASGSVINVALNSNNYVVDLNKLQSDSAFLGLNTTVPVGTYDLTLVFSSPVVTYCHATAGVPGCNLGSIAKFNGGAATTTIKGAIIVVSNVNQGIRVKIDMNQALTVDASQNVTAMDLTKANVMTASALPVTPASAALTNGQLDYVEDITGVITATDNVSVVTIQTATLGSITAHANANTLFSINCAAATFSGCVRASQVASIDTILNSDGTFTLIEYDPLDTISTDWIEGVVSLQPTATNQFDIITTNFVGAQIASQIGTFTLGSAVHVTLPTTIPGFGVDWKNMNVFFNSFLGSTDATAAIAPGQTIAVRVTGLTAGNPALATVDFVGLRFTRLTATIATTPAPNFTVTTGSFAPFYGITGPNPLVTVTLAPNVATYYDGVTGPSNPTNHVSLRTLYFNPTTAAQMFAAKVRQQP